MSGRDLGWALPVGQAERGSVAERADDDKLAADGRLGTLGLEDGADTGRDAHADTVDDAADDHLGQMPGDDLENGAHGVEEHAAGHALFPAKAISEEEGQNGAAERAELCGVSECFGNWFVARLTAKQLEVMPDMLASLVSGNRRLKSLEMRTPEKTPGR